MKPPATNKVIGADMAAFLETGSQSETSGRQLSIPGWGESEWSTLFAYTTATGLEAGEVLIEQNASDRTLFFAASGKLQVALINRTDNSVCDVTTIAPGSVVGEFAFFDGGPRSAKVWAVSRCRLLQLTLHDYERFRREHPTLAADLLFAIARLLAIRIRNTNSLA